MTALSGAFLRRVVRHWLFHRLRHTRLFHLLASAKKERETLDFVLVAFLRLQCFPEINRFDRLADLEPRQATVHTEPTGLSRTAPRSGNVMRGGTDVALLVCF
jgi:hypothetical protein